MSGPDYHILDERYYSRQALADMLGKAKGTLEVWASRGVGPKFIKIGKLPLYPEKEIASWIGTPLKRS